MTRQQMVVFWSLLIVIGIGWGVTQPLTKMAVSTGHQPLGLIFWQLLIGAVAIGGFLWARGDLPRLTRPAIIAGLIIALIGTLIPNSASYKAIAHLPAGVTSILLSLIPMMAFPMALALRLEVFSALRFAGLAAGLAGVLFLVLPEASLPDPAMLVWIPVALISPLCYAFEGNYVAKWGTGGLNAAQILFLASVFGAIIALPLAFAAGHFISPFRPWELAEWALVLSSVIHVVVYAGYVWLVGRAGPVFAIQVSYVVTAAGVVWAMLLLGESYSPYIWASLLLVLIGVFLVQPRGKDDGKDRLAPDSSIDDTAH